MENFNRKQFANELENARNKNPHNQENNMVNKSKILPIDDTREIEQREKQKIHQVEHNKQKQHEHNTVEIEEEKEKSEDKEAGSKEFPHFEINFDPFAPQ